MALNYFLYIKSNSVLYITCIAHKDNGTGFERKLKDILLETRKKKKLESLILCSLVKKTHFSIHQRIFISTERRHLEL